ncbi:MAG TPA: class III poly(R)-hydroxyalkanoic acid synthase subunit PhaC [Thermoleophilia bacterium]|nr:class III poly(R)-hydroxyalkanoic acid synthase subunit PhaC [Thermoleophilia bacterium]
MFPINIRPEDAFKELIDFNQKLLAGVQSIADVEEIDVAPTPREVVYQEDKTVLYHYPPKVENPHAIPILIVYALVNRPYMIDIQHDRSMVQNLLNLGLDLYLIDWGYVDRGDRYLTLDDYINGYIDNCVNVVRERHGLDKINLLGICQGGTMSLCYASLHPGKVQNLITMVTPVDFDTKDGLLNVWAQHLDVDAMVDAFGNVPGHFMNGGFLMLKPFQLMAEKYVGFIDTVENEASLKSFLRMEKWIFDSPDQAGETFRQFIKDFYQQNKLIKGEVQLGDRRVDLKNVTMPVFNVYATEDHLVPPCSSLSLEEFVGSEDVTTVDFPGGHIGIYVSGRSQKQLAPALAEWVKERG